MWSIFLLEKMKTEKDGMKVYLVGKYKRQLDFVGYCLSVSSAL